MESALKILGIDYDPMAEIEDWLGLCEWKRNDLPRQILRLHCRHPLPAFVHLG